MVNAEYKKAEYNAFGPWILETTEKYPLPPLFIPYYKEDENYLMRIKIPRNIERRKANPDMDLYDYVIGLYENYIYILERDGENVKESKVFYDKIECLENYINLLSGKMNIFLDDRKVTIPYNAVSEDIIASMMRIIRDKYARKAYSQMQSPYDNKHINIKETLYNNLLYEMNINGEKMNINVIQHSVRLHKGNNIWEKSLQLLKDESLLSTLHLSSESEILIITRGTPFKKRTDRVYSYSYTYIPIERICRVTFEKDNCYSNLQRLDLHTKNNVFMFYFNDSNRESKIYSENFGRILDKSYEIH